MDDEPLPIAICRDKECSEPASVVVLGMGDPNGNEMCAEHAAKMLGLARMMGWPVHAVPITTPIVPANPPAED